MQWAVCRATCAPACLLVFLMYFSSDVFLFFFLFCCSLFAGEILFLFFYELLKLQQSVATCFVF